MKTAAELGTLDYLDNGAPFVRISTSATDAGSLDLLDNGTPFYAAPSTYTPPVITYKTSQFFVMF